MLTEKIKYVMHGGVPKIPISSTGTLKSWVIAPTIGTDLEYFKALVILGLLAADLNDTEIESIYDLMVSHFYFYPHDPTGKPVEDRLARNFMRTSWLKNTLHFLIEVDPDWSSTAMSTEDRGERPHLFPHVSLEKKDHITIPAKGVDHIPSLTGTNYHYGWRKQGRFWKQTPLYWQREKKSVAGPLEDVNYDIVANPTQENYMILLRVIYSLYKPIIETYRNYFFYNYNIDIDKLKLDGSTTATQEQVDEATKVEAKYDSLIRPEIFTIFATTNLSMTLPMAGKIIAKAGNASSIKSDPDLLGLLEEFKRLTNHQTVTAPIPMPTPPTPAPTPPPPPSYGPPPPPPPSYGAPPPPQIKVAYVRKLPGTEDYYTKSEFLSKFHTYKEWNQALPTPREEEVRKNNHSKAYFYNKYKNNEEWDAAAPSAVGPMKILHNPKPTPPTPYTRPPAASSPHDRPQRSSLDGKFYTREEFITEFGLEQGILEWDSAADTQIRLEVRKDVDDKKWHSYSNFLAKYKREADKAWNAVAPYNMGRGKSRKHEKSSKHKKSKKHRKSSKHEKSRKHRKHRKHRKSRKLYSMLERVQTV